MHVEHPTSFPNGSAHSHSIHNSIRALVLLERNGTEQRRLHTTSNRHTADWVAWNTGPSEQSRNGSKGAESCISCASEEG